MFKWASDPGFELLAVFVAAVKLHDALEFVRLEPGEAAAVFDLAQPADTFFNLLGGGFERIAVQVSELFENESVVIHNHLFSLVNLWEFLKFGR